MSLLERSLTHKAAPTFAPARGQGYRLINDRLVAYKDSKDTYFKHGYDMNDIVYAIVTLIMDKIRVAPWNVYRIADESAYKSLMGMQRKREWSAKDFSMAQGYQRKALEIVNDPGKLGELLQWPNEEETFSDMVAHGAGFKMLTGDMYVWANLLRAGANSGLPNALHLMPSQEVSIYCTDNFPSTVTGYSMSFMPGEKYTPEEILHTKYWNPEYTVAGSQHYGVAPLRAALNLLQRNNSSMHASASAFKNEGVKGILTHDVEPGNVDGQLLQAEVGKLAETLRDQWSGERNRGRIGLGGYRMQWLPIGLSSEDMQVIESEKWDMRRLCNIFGIQSQLLNDPDNKTYANQEEAEKSLTTRAALPHLTSFRDNLNRKLQQHWGVKKGIIADFDMTVYSELAQDMGKMVTALTPLMDRGLPLNRVLELLNLELIDNPYYDQPRVTVGMGQTIEDHELNIVDDALNDAEDESPAA